MTITIHLVRHAQGFHNLNHINEAIPDPYLTPKGLAQCAALRDSFPRHDRVTHLVASPMRRTLLTCHHSFNDGSAQPKKIKALPLVQEISGNPCDVGSEPVVLRAEFGSLREDGQHAWLDDGELVRGWNDKVAAASPWAPLPERLEARALGARRWLRRMGREAEKEGLQDVEIVVVTHGGFLHFLTQDWDGMDVARGTAWENTEWRSYEFVNPGGNDEDEAEIRETEESWRRRRGTAKPLGATEQQQARAAVIEAMRVSWLGSGSDEGGRSAL